LLYFSHLKNRTIIAIEEIKTGLFYIGFSKRKISSKRLLQTYKI